ncbi:tetraacyldisaccharide 4'-kinase [Hymenobacter sp. J193]|uniref:tetraacyldisaccharide 4'-kinase n=1 Tax=Hymenobacter sp. J193 TaxID=2898429 RepID=UPI002151F838|nr:tetraacyldisaccharide 4'-kinase [Hymenobacter sp. J193]MCR5889933.1 tetraacyldisaccharide 4'-kinase [Hymenobacter sp. J193]
MNSFVTLLLLPLSWLYASVMAVRNWLYDTGLKVSSSFPVPLIVVGNLRVGGTGKTPHVAWVVRELQQLGEQPAILSRGYGRQTRGYRRVTPQETATTVGDEPLQHWQDFAGAVPVAVAEDRRLGIRHLLAETTATAVVLDDAYQHRRVQPTLSFLLTEHQRPFYEDWVLPAGRLRESRGGARRADVIIVTKCPAELPAAEQVKIRQRIGRYSRPGAPVLFSSYTYGAPVAVGAAALASPAGVLLTGIAQPGPLREYLTHAGYALAHHAAFADHHAFTAAEIRAVVAQLPPGGSIFTTQKDAMRLREPALQAALAGVPVFFIPIEVRLLGDGARQLRQFLMSSFQPHAVV